MEFKSFLLVTCLFLNTLVLPDTLETPFLTYPAVLADERFVSSGRSQVSAKSVINYWTEERMGNAIPYPMKSPERPPGFIPAGSIPKPANGEPGSHPGGLPEFKGRLSSKDDKNSDSSELLPLVEPLANGYDFPFPFTRFEVLRRLYSTYPYRTIGRVFFTQGGQNFSCSGSLIGGRAVLTAGHCVSDGAGNFHTNWTFVPAYRDGRRPFGTWTAEELLTFEAWHNNGELCRDVGFAVTRNVGGRTLSQRVGWLGFVWNQDAEKIHWNIFGYPAQAPFNGRRMIECQASFATWDVPGCNTPRTHGVGCDQTGGSSGGTWVKNFVPGVVGDMNFANSVNSYTHRDQQSAIYGPYFDSAVKDLKDTAVGK